MTGSVRADEETSKKKLTPRCISLLRTTATQAACAKHRHDGALFVARCITQTKRIHV